MERGCIAEARSGGARWCAYSARCSSGRRTDRIGSRRRPSAARSRLRTYRGPRSRWIGAGVGSGQVLSFRTNVDQVVTAGPEHPITIKHGCLDCAPVPYLRVRDSDSGMPLEARISRAVYYELVALAVPGEVCGKRCSGSGASTGSSRSATCRSVVGRASCRPAATTDAVSTGRGMNIDMIRARLAADPSEAPAEAIAMLRRRTMRRT